MVRMNSPSPSLAYLIGAMLGDGSVFSYVQKRPKVSVHYWVVLGATDFEFLNEVREAVGKIVGRLPMIKTLYQHKSSISAGNRIFRLAFCDKNLFNFLSQPLERLKPFIKAYPTDFLRGFFDAEGSAWVVKRTSTKKRIRHGKEPVVKYSNTEKSLLEYTKELLIDTRIFPAPKLISECYVCINGEKRLRPKTLYSLLIYRKDSVRRFMSLIGSSIPRKRLVL